jgi:hypothetical protein
VIARQRSRPKEGRRRLRLLASFVARSTEPLERTAWIARLLRHQPLPRKVKNTPNLDKMRAEGSGALCIATLPT